MVGTVKKIFAALLACCLLLAGCAPEETIPQQRDPDALYWNVDRGEPREPGSDGTWQVRFVCDGKKETLTVADEETVRNIDAMDLMGLRFDSQGVVTQAIGVENMPYQQAGWDCWVRRVTSAQIAANTSMTLAGEEVNLARTADTKIYDMTGDTDPVGTEKEPEPGDRIRALLTLDGQLYRVYIVDHPDTNPGYQMKK